MATTKTNDKAIRLLAEGAVRPDPGLPPQLFHVEGDHGRYAVVVGATVQMCSCPSTGTCSHILAAVAWETATPSQRELMVEALDERRARDRVAGEAAFARLA